MASNKDLRASITLLDATAVTSELNNAQLSALLKQLKADAESEADISEADAAAQAEKDALANAVNDDDDDDELLQPDVEVVAVAPYSIAAGKSVTCKKGILAHGDEIKAEYLGGEQKALDALVIAKVVVKA